MDRLFDTDLADHDPYRGDEAEQITGSVTEARRVTMQDKGTS